MNLPIDRILSLRIFLIDLGYQLGSAQELRSKFHNSYTALDWLLKLTIRQSEQSDRSLYELGLALSEFLNPPIDDQQNENIAFSGITREAIERERARLDELLEPINPDFMRALGPMFEDYRQINGNVNDLSSAQPFETEQTVFDNIANAINQKAEFVFDYSELTGRDIKSGIIDFLNNGMNSEILPDGQVGLHGWQLYLDFMKERYPYHFVNISNLNSDPENDDDSLATKIMSFDHELNEHDLAIISRIFGVKFILINGNVGDLTCLSTTQTLEPWTIMLYRNLGSWHVIVKRSQSASDSFTRQEEVEQEPLWGGYPWLGLQYIWNQDIPELALPYNFYNRYYLPKCGNSDQKNTVDLPNTTLMRAYAGARDNARAVVNRRRRLLPLRR